MGMASRRTNLALVILGAALSGGVALGGCSSNPVPADGVGGDVGADSTAADGPGGDQGGENPCEPGTCRFQGDTTGECLPPGGPIGMPDAAPSLSGCCGCGDDGFCNAECKCAAPDTPIATPGGERPIAELEVGDLVYSIDGGERVAVPIRAVRRRPVLSHRVMEVVLDSGAVLNISAAHPTADGRDFGQLRTGDWMGGREVISARVVPYAHEATHDILPDSDTGTYFAAGALIGSTIPRPGHPSTGSDSAVSACLLPPQ
jgi:hypothetical protein